jgi:hypothetical protein
MESLPVFGDAWCIICANMDTLQQLVLLCKTNKKLKEYLDDGKGGEHWIRIARGICGEQYWAHPSASQPMKEAAIRRLCPWRDPYESGHMSVGLLQAVGRAGINLNDTIGDETVLCFWIRIFKNTDCSELLAVACNLGANVNASTHHETPRTPLMYAVSYFNLKHIRTLLDLGADTSIKGEENKTAGVMLQESTNVRLDGGGSACFRPFYRDAEWQSFPLPRLSAVDVDAALSLLGAAHSLEEKRALAAEQRAFGEAIHSYDDVFSRFSNI